MKPLKHCFAKAFFGKKVAITGHTGFKGAWLAFWLHLLGAKVAGYSLEPPTSPALFDILALDADIDHQIGDIRDLAGLKAWILRQQPDFLFHLAAQPIVRFSYEEPLTTYQVNVNGTIHVLESLRSLDKPCIAIMVTTDKCYENREWVYGYREVDPLGGHDPYSSSKAAAELAISAWRRSFFKDHPVMIASARAGNVIGGGDWAKDRIVPDCIRFLREGKPIIVRNKSATRPWQHVLEPLSGYLWLAAVLARPTAIAGSLGEGELTFNFGPDHRSNKTVEELVREILRYYPGQWEDRSDPGAVHEAGLLQLSIAKARHHLKWFPAWDFQITVEQTVRWYRKLLDQSTSDQMREMTRKQIADYTKAAHSFGIPWASDE